MTMKCTGATGWISWNAKISSSSNTLLHRILPLIILQKMQSSKTGSLLALGLDARTCGPGGLLVDSGNALAALELEQHVGRPQAVVRQHDQAVKPQVGGLADDAQLVPVLGGHHGFGGFLADFFQNRVFAAGEQARN